MRRARRSTTRFAARAKLGLEAGRVSGISRVVLPDFRDLRFGYANAETESAHDPELLLRGYVDHNEISADMLTSHRFLLLGYKGSGKSAIVDQRDTIIAPRLK